MKKKFTQKAHFNGLRFIAVLFTFMFLSNQSWGQATLPHVDQINYTVGQSLTTQTGWTLLNTATSDLLIASGNLTYTGMPASAGNKIAFSSTGEDAAKLFTQQTTGTVYYSFLLNVTGFGSLNTTGGYFTGFNEGTSTTYGATVWLRKDVGGVGYNIGINPKTTAANTAWVSGVQPLNTTLFVVISYQIVSGTLNDVVKIWINPTPGAVEPSASASATNGLASDLANINRILLRQDAATTTPLIEMDELRIGTSWADVNPAITPTIATPAPTSLSGFSTTAGTPSASQTFTISGTNLSTDLVITAPANYEVRENGIGSFGSSVSFTPSSGTVGSKTIEVRIAATAGVGTPGGNVTCTSTGATSQNVAVSGTVLAAATPILTVTPTTLTGFTYLLGNGPSAIKSYTISGTDLTPASGNITVTGSTNYEVSSDSVTFSSGYTIAYTSATLGLTKIYVRLKSGLSGGNYNSEIITNTGGGATQADVTCSGSVTIPPPVITVGTITTFGFQIQNTISAEKSYAVTGADLTANVVIKAPVGYQISTTSGLGFISNPDSIVLTPTSGAVSATIYVKFAPTAVQAYTGNITHTSTGATTKNVAVSGTGSCTTTALPLIENFDYTAATLLTANCWTNHSGTTNYINVTSSSITYPGYLSSGIGNEVSMNTSGEDVNRPFDAQNTGVLYASFLVNISTLQTSDYFVNLAAQSGSSGVSTFAGRVWVKKDPGSANFAFGLSKSSTAGNVNYTPYSYSVGTTYLVAIKHYFVSGATNDSTVLFINPALNTIEPTPTLKLLPADIITADPSQLTSFCLRQGSGTAAPTLKIDGLRVSTVWTDIIGTIDETPVITLNKDSLNGFTYVQGNGPSTEKTFTVTGAYLPDTLYISAPTNYEISTGTGGSFVATNPIKLVPASGTIAATTIYVRLKAGLLAGNYNNESITASSTGAVSKTVICSGTVDAVPDPVVTVVPSTLLPFSTITGTASATQSYTVSADLLVQNLVVTASIPTLELSTDSLNFYSTLTLTQLGGNLVGEPVKMWVRIVASALPGAISGNIAHTSLNLTTVNIPVSGTVYYAEPSNQASNFTSISPTYSSVTLSWLDNDGATPATGYLILANTTGVFTSPVDGVAQANDFVLADSIGVTNVNHGVQNFTWYNLVSSTRYYFAIYPYSNTGVNINYKVGPDTIKTDVITQTFDQPIAAWTFDATPAMPSTPISVSANYGHQSGTAAIYADGTNGSSLWNVTSSTSTSELTTFSGSTMNDPREGINIIAGNSYCPLGGAQSGVIYSANGKSMIIKFSLTQHKDPILSFSTRGTATGFNFHQWAWSTDGVTFTDFGSNTAHNTSTWTLKTLDMTAIDQLDNAATVYLKVTFLGATSSAGNNRFDNIVIRATEIPLTKTLNAKLFLEGLYNSGTGLMNQAQGISGAQFGGDIADTVGIALHDTAAPYSVAHYFGNINLSANGTLSLTTIPGTVTGKFYMVVKNRNSIETWSALPVDFTVSPVTYDFTTASNQAYGNNMSLSGTDYVFWGGDVTQDGAVDGSDMAAVDNASTTLLAGYYPEDVNGDGIVDGSDMALIDNNATVITMVIKP